MTPEELEKLPKPIERTMTTLELSIMNEIVQRIKASAQITPVTDWMLNRLTAIGVSKSKIKRMRRPSNKLDCRWMISTSRLLDLITSATERYMRLPVLTISHMRTTNGCSRLWMLPGGRPRTA